MKRILRVLAPGVAALILAGGAWGQAYPSKPVRIIVPAGPGGPDVVGRIVAAKLTEQTGQNFFVENHPGANGIVGADMVAKAAPDGYTLMVYSSGLISNKSLYKKLPYDTDKDFAPISNLVDNGGLFITVNPAVPAKSLKELIELAKKPGSHLAYSTPGVGNTWHVATEVFNHYAGTHLTHVPYKGGGLAAAALASGEVQVMLSSPAPVMQYIKNGKARVLAYTATKRSPALPDVPTTAEAGLPTVLSDNWYGLAAPAGIPKDILERIHATAVAVLKTSEAAEPMMAQGAVIRPMTPAEYTDFVRQEREKWGPVVKASGAKMD